MKNLPPWCEIFTPPDQADLQRASTAHVTCGFAPQHLQVTALGGEGGARYVALVWPVDGDKGGMVLSVDRATRS